MKFKHSVLIYDKGNCYLELDKNNYKLLYIKKRNLTNIGDTSTREQYIQRDLGCFIEKITTKEKLYDAIYAIMDLQVDFRGQLLEYVEF
jgi:uncharacterized protein YlbG (UPF0298 family)